MTMTATTTTTTTKGGLFKYKQDSCSQAQRFPRKTK